MSRIRIFTGYFGSGKTEIAINYALELVKKQARVCVVDLDIVNPYFCSRDVTNELESKGIRLLSANPNLANAELGVVSPEVMAAFNDERCDVVIDVGGDDLGALALGQFNSYLRRESYELYFVVNLSRPATATRESILACLRRVEDASRLKVTHFISNTNLSFETIAKDVIRGDVFVSTLANDLNLPHAYTVCTRDLVGEVKEKVRGQVLPIDVYMKTPWM